MLTAADRDDPTSTKQSAVDTNEEEIVKCLALFGDVDFKTLPQVRSVSKVSKQGSVLLYYCTERDSRGCY